MALSASTVWEVRDTGSSTNGGGYVSGGTDYSQQDSAQLAVTDAACTGNTTLTSATGGFTSAMVGNIVYLSSGPGRYQITAYTNTNTVTIDRNGPNATGMTANVGGALDSPATAASYMVAGNLIWVKGSFNVSAAMQFVGSSQGGQTSGAIRGYSSTRGDSGRATITATGGSAYNMLATVTNASFEFHNLVVDGGLRTTIAGIVLNGRGLIRNCDIKQCTNSAVSGGGDTGIVEWCRITGCTTAVAVTGTAVIDSEIYSNTAGGVGSATLVVRNLIYGNTGTGVAGLTTGARVIGNTIYNNTSHGIDASSARVGLVICGNVLVSNGGYGINNANSTFQNPIFNNAFYNNTSGAYPTTGVTAAADNITLTGDPFTNAASNDFSLNNTSGAGAACRAVRVPGTFTRGTTVDYGDVGAVQHQDSGGGGSGLNGNFFVGGNVSF